MHINNDILFTTLAAHLDGHSPPVDGSWLQRIIQNPSFFSQKIDLIDSDTHFKINNNSTPGIAGRTDRVGELDRPVSAEAGACEAGWDDSDNIE